MTAVSRSAGHLAKRLQPLTCALGIGALGGLIFNTLHAPLPWMLGAMLATSAAALYGVPVSIPRRLRNAFVPVLGVMFGSVIDVRLLPSAGQLLLLVILVVAYLVLTMGLGYLYFRLAGLDKTSSFFASVPGNFSEVVLVADSLGADIRSVALVHSARLVIAIPVISFGLQLFLHIDTTSIALLRPDPLDLSSLAMLVLCGVVGYALAFAIRMPAPQMFGPLVLSALAHTWGLVDGAPPAAAVAGAQVLLGTFAGARFSGISVREIVRVLSISAVWAVLLLVIICGFAAAAVQVIDQPIVAVFLAFSPGGFAEVSMVAIAAGMGLGLISTAQFIRMVVAILIIPLIIQGAQRWRSGATPPEQGQD